MAKEKVFRPKIDNAGVRKKIRFFYTEKFFNKWMSKYDYTLLNYQQKHYIMKKFWCDGSICGSKINNADSLLDELMRGGVIKMGSNSIIFTPWTFANRYNIYDFPTHVRLINTRGVKFITAKALEIDKEAVIIYAQKNHKSVFSSIEAKLDELVDVEMKKRVARKAQSQPWFIGFSPEDYSLAKNLQEQLENDNPYLFAPVNDPNSLKGITSGAPYIVDKFEQDRQKIENDILTMLGVNNVGIGEKKEHLIVDEVNANNEDIEQQSISYKSEIEDGFERLNKIFGLSIQVIDMNEEFKENEDEIDEKEDNPDDED